MNEFAKCKNCGRAIYEYPASKSGWTHPDSGIGNAWCQPYTSRTLAEPEPTS